MTRATYRRRFLIGLVLLWFVTQASVLTGIVHTHIAIRDAREDRLVDAMMAQFVAQTGLRVVNIKRTRQWCPSELVGNAYAVELVDGERRLTGVACFDEGEINLELSDGDDDEGTDDEHV